MACHPVTQRDYSKITGRNPSVHPGQDHPVENVAWKDAMQYCHLLTGLLRSRGRLPKGMVCRLPTEAEWEYAARAGTSSPTAFGPTLDSSQANFDGTAPYNQGPTGPSRSGTTPVRSFAPNAWGLYDMHGNVWEWVLDGAYDYSGDPETDPYHPPDLEDDDDWHSLRGGSWDSEGYWCRSAQRFGEECEDGSTGFRVVIAPPVVA